MSASTFFSELKRRQIYRGGVMYVVAGWVIVQVASTLFPIFSIPEWAIRLVVVAILLGFPLALVGLWMFESTGHRLPPAAASAAPQVERRRSSDDGGAIARLMETERAERQRANEELIAALDRLHATQHGPHADAPARDAAQPAPQAPLPQSRRFRFGTVFTAVFVAILGAWIVWVLVAPSVPVPRVGDAGKLTHDYVLPAYRQAEQLGAALLAPLLHKLGIDVAPERVFTALMMVVALLVLRNLYRSMARTRRLRHQSMR